MAKERPGRARGEVTGAEPVVEVLTENRHSGRDGTLTVGMATYDDYDGVYFTVMSLLLYHPEAMRRCRLLLVDNHPSGPHAAAFARLARAVPGLRYVPYDRRVGTAARDRVFREADTEWVLCVDSHVQLHPGALDALLAHIDEDPDSGDLVQGPLVSEDADTVSTHWEPRWGQGMYGQWGSDPRGADPGAPAFEIGMQGLGVFACRTKAWPGLNPAFTGHGGEEGYLHEKFRRGGHSVRCLPALRWTHRFDGPRPAPATRTWYQRLRNYLIAHDELGLPADEALAHFAEFLGEDAVREGVARYRAERAHPFSAFDAVTCVCVEDRPERRDRLRARLDAWGVRPDRVHHQPAVTVSAGPLTARALAHRTAIREARTDGLTSVLVLEDDTVLLDGALWVLRRALAELGARPWSVLHLDGAAETASRVDGCHHLETVTDAADGRAVAYHRDVFTRLLDELPDTEAEMAAWVERHTSVPAYLARCGLPDRYRTIPPVAAREDGLDLVADDLRDQFTR
ncbi:glycosyltransferase [Streptomyces griseoviridis]|uniref:glycosyltransferase n=1 Tax=Streptomyces griseoviridis TaxID=45398 RepID=UPI003452E4F7